MPEDKLTAESGTQNIYPEEASREMIEAGVFYGRKKSKTNPKMKRFVIANRTGIDIIDLAKTAENLETALSFLREKVKNGALALLAGTQPAAEEGIMNLAAKFSLPYVTNRWAGGTLTNFKIISKRVEHFKKLRAGLTSGAFDKYTKKERLEIEREVNRLKELFGGLENLTREPNVLLVIDPGLHSMAVREAKITKIPIIALSNIDSDPDFIDYLVPGNDKARKSINWFLGKIGVALEEGFAAKKLIPVVETGVKTGIAPKAKAEIAKKTNGK